MTSMKIILLISFTFFVGYFCNSQEIKPKISKGVITGSSYSEKSSEPIYFNPRDFRSNEFFFRIQRTQKFNPVLKEIELEKKTKTDLKKQFLHNPKSEEKFNKTEATPPQKGREFIGNSFGGYYPNDNNIAISNSGYIVSVINSRINFYSQNGSLLNSFSLEDFANNSQLTSAHYDPVCLYDPGANRFIVVHLHGTVSTESKVVVAFSKSDNPMDGFWVYTLNGNVGNRGNWFDYPKIGISSNDLFITGNLFDNSDNFSEPVILQIPKSPGYSGNSFNYTYWLDIKDGDNNTPFTLLPLSGGYGNYGPGIYLVSTRSNNGSKVHLYDITNDYGQNPTLQSYAINTTSYSVGGKAFQKNTSNTLDNGDCRALSGFYANGICHFVFCSEYENGFNGINYNRLSISSSTNESSKFGLSGYDYCYPSIAPMGVSSTDKTVCIGFLRSGDNIFPECRAVVVDDGMNWSGSITVKEGEDYVDIASGNDERWGDYTGTAKKFNAITPTVWFAGSYGRTTLIESNINGTWIAELISNQASPNDEILQTAKNFSLFPNPTNEKYFHLSFSLEESENLTITIYDSQGRIIKNLFKGWVKPGEHRITFNEYALVPGIYFIKIFNENQVIANEKLVIIN